MKNASKRIRSSYSFFIISIIQKVRFILIASLGSITFILITVFVIKSGHILPSPEDFKLLVDWHPFEQFDKIYKTNFIIHNSRSTISRGLPLRFIWGVQPVSSANYLASDVKGAYETHPFDISSKEAQVYMYEFCRKVRSIKYYTREVGLYKNSCFMEHFRRLMRRGCRDLEGASLFPCCSSSIFPFDRRVYHICLHRFLPTLARNALLYSHHKTAGLRFDANFTRPTALIVEFVSNVPHDLDYRRMKQFYHYMRNFTQAHVQLTAPRGLRKGWFSSEVLFFDLQNSLLRGVTISLLISFLATCFTCIIFTGFTLLSLFSVLTISLSCSSSLLILFLFGWTLNVFESMAFTLVVGLSVDFTLHNAIAFKHASVGQRASKVEQVVSINGAIFLAGLTTFTVAAFLHGSIVVAYKQLSILLMTVIVCSWVYSTFFFFSLLTTLETKR